MTSAPRLLLLEDDPAIARTVAYALGREGFVVDCVSWLHEARSRLTPQGHGYSAALLDVGLPDGSGFDLCRDLRRAQALLPIVMLTARDEELDKVLGLELGADDYICKPFSPRELCARVRALLRRAAHNPVAALSPPTGPPLFEFDADGLRVRCAGRWLELTRRELALLEVLWRWPQRVWTREALLEAAWGPDAESIDRTIDTHIKTLRGKLRAHGLPTDPIRTHRGLGYSLSQSVSDALPG